MGDSSPFVSSCSRRQLARRRAGRARLYMVTPLSGRRSFSARFYAVAGPLLMTASVVVVGLGAFLVGRGI